MHKTTNLNSFLKIIANIMLLTQKFQKSHNYLFFYIKLFHCQSHLIFYENYICAIINNSSFIFPLSEFYY